MTAGLFSYSELIADVLACVIGLLALVAVVLRFLMAVGAR